MVTFFCSRYLLQIWDISISIFFFNFYFYLFFAHFSDHIPTLMELAPEIGFLFICSMRHCSLPLSHLLFLPLSHLLFLPFHYFLQALSPQFSADCPPTGAGFGHHDLPSPNLPFLQLSAEKIGNDRPGIGEEVCRA